MNPKDLAAEAVVASGILDDIYEGGSLGEDRDVEQDAIDIIDAAAEHLGPPGVLPLETPDQQLDWIDSHAHRDPDWARNEMEVRRMAYEMRDQVLKSTGPAIFPFHALDHATGSFKTVMIRSESICRVGGLEQLLLIEEIIRRMWLDAR